MREMDAFGLGAGLPRLRRGLRVDHLGDERLVLDPASGVVHTIRGAAVEVLDRVLAGRPVSESEILTAFVGAGIVEVGGFTRRRALAMASSALALIGSAALPSAAAAASASGLSFAAGTGGSITDYTLGDGATLYRAVAGSVSTDDVEFTLNVGPVEKLVEIVLVGGGGPGGDRLADSVDFFGGGGGGGEVSFFSFGTVPASTVLRFTIGGFSKAGLQSESVGNASTVREVTGPSTSFLVAQALGGGRGGHHQALDGGSFVAAEPGGSGGGGSSGSTMGAFGGDRLTSYSGYAVMTNFDLAIGGVGGGGDGNAYAGGGGGGSLQNGSSATGSTGESSMAGDGGTGHTLDQVATEWDFTGTGALVPLPTLGAGGGGAGLTEAQAGDSSGGGEGGYPIVEEVNPRAIGGGEGEVGSGGGGGGGVTHSATGGASGGRGASGSVWIRLAAAQ